MADKNTIKSWFQTNLKPIQAHFWVLLDSYRHNDDVIPITAIEGIANILDEKADAEALTNLAAVVSGSKIYAQAEMQIFKTRGPDDEDYVPEQQEGDFCVGIVWDSEINKKWIQGTYLGGSIKAAESYNYETSINF